MLTDSHCHLEQFDDAGAVLDEAAAAGVGAVVTMSQEESSIEMSLELAARFPGRVFAAVGIHPVEVVTLASDELDSALRRLETAVPQAHQVGETGLDHKWATDEQTQARQRRVMERHFELAAAHGRAVNLHSRRCLRQVMEAAIAFRRDTGLPAQLHWFTQSKKLIRLTNDAQVHVSVGPSILIDEQAAAVAVEIDDDLLLVETDAPVRTGPRSGHPRNVADVVEKLAGLRRVEPSWLKEKLAANQARLLVDTR